MWSEDAQPDGYPDTIQYDFNLTDEAEVTAVAIYMQYWFPSSPAWAWILVFAGSHRAPPPYDAAREIGAVVEWSWPRPEK